MFYVLACLVYLFGAALLGYLAIEGARGARRIAAKRRNERKVHAEILNVQDQQQRRYMLDQIASVRSDRHQLQRLPPLRPAATRRRPKNPDLTRVECTVCNKQITLNKDGRIRSHGGESPCPGGGISFVDYLIREEPW